MIVLTAFLIVAQIVGAVYLLRRMSQHRDPRWPK
jgi:hypothetical protein